MRRTAIAAFFLALALAACAKPPSTDAMKDLDAPQFAGKMRGRVQPEQEAQEVQVKAVTRNSSGARGVYGGDLWQPVYYDDSVQHFIESANYYYQWPSVDTLARIYLDSQGATCTRFTVALATNLNQARLAIDSVPIYYSYYGPFNQWGVPGYAPSIPFGIAAPLWTRSADRKTTNATVEVPYGERVELTLAMLNGFGTTATASATVTAGPCQAAGNACANGACTSPTGGSATVSLNDKLTQFFVVTRSNTQVGSGLVTFRTVRRQNPYQYIEYYPAVE